MDAIPQYKSVAASTVVVKGKGRYWGYIVTTVTAVAALQIRDATAAGAGTVIDTIPTATAIGSRGVLPVPISVESGIVFDLNGGTGGITLLYEGAP